MRKFPLLVVSAMLVVSSISAAVVAPAVVTADLKLVVQGDKIVANIVVKQDGNGDNWADGSVIVQWIAPANAYCSDSTITLKYKASDRYRTHANRTWQLSIPKTDCVAACVGTWTVRVIANSDAATALASDQITIGPDGKEVTPTIVPRKK